MHKYRFEQLSIEEWERLACSAASPTFFAKPAWVRAVAEAHPHLTAWPLRCSLADGREAVIPLMRAKGGRLGWTILVGMPFGGYTAVLEQDGSLVDAPTAGAILEQLLISSDSVRVNPWPLRPLQTARTTLKEPQETSVIDISGGVEQALSRISGKSRRMAGQARRRGVVCSIEGGTQAVDTYYALLADAAQKRWHLSAPNVTKELLRQVIIHGKESAQVWIARCDAQPIAGGIALWGSEEVMLWTTATRVGMEIFRPHNVLHADIIQYAAERGVHWYNLGSSSKLAGVLKFKEALGAVSVPYDTLVHERALFRLTRALKHMLRAKDSRGGQLDQSDREGSAGDVNAALS